MLDPLCQLDDIRAAITHVRSLNSVDATKIVLSGFSLPNSYLIIIVAMQMKLQQCALKNK
jgi:cephalosporin-C deacetylase-like acetyl esterase